MPKFLKVYFLTTFCIVVNSNFAFSTILISQSSNLSPSFDSITILKRVYKRGYSKEKIIQIPKGQRPLPRNYLKNRYIRRHNRPFRRGASFLTPANILDKYGRNQLGRKDGLFVMSKQEMNRLILNANGQLNYIESELGIPKDSWENTTIIRIDIPRPKKFHIRIPSGNEEGANNLWIPGGKLPNGFSESVIDPIPQGKYQETILILKN